MSSKFSLEWFKNWLSPKEKEPETLTSTTTAMPQESSVKKVYRNARLINDVITVVLNNGDIVFKPKSTVEDFEKIRNCSSEKELLSLLSTPEVVEEKLKREAETEKVLKIHSGIKLLEKLSDFKVDGNSVYLVESNRTLPELLVNEFSSVVGEYEDKPISEIEELLKQNDYYQGLRNFFLWACLNPRAEVANELYGFLKKNSFRITKQGFFAALRNVVTVSEDTEKIQFISNAYNKVKAVWKKVPGNYRVVLMENEEYVLEKDNSDESEGEIIGNLAKLYADLPNMQENRFTDAHTHTFDIRVGQVVSMPPEECSWSTADCAHAGLHFTSDQIHYVGCGDTSVLVLINPMKVVGIGQHKGRCYEYLPIMTVPSQEATELLHDLDFDTLTLDEDYVIQQLQNLEETMKHGFTAELTKHEFNLPNITNVQMSNIVKSLSKMKAVLKDRIEVIK